MTSIVDIARQGLGGLLRKEGLSCSCGKRHHTELREVVMQAGALQETPRLVEKYGGSRVFLIADQNTYQVAGQKAAALLGEAGIDHEVFIFADDYVQPTDASLEQVLAKFSGDCDMILGVGSGTINDISKLAAKERGVSYICVATAPSMDGFVSNTSSMVMKGIKVSIESTVPLAVVADLDILAAAPERLLQAGFGDILAKYTSIAEWRISNLITGEYYCEQIAELMRMAVRNCVANVEGLAKREPEAVKYVMESLILSGIAMAFAGFTRPASGVEHYFSHTWDMRYLEFHTPKDFHGIQCGIGTVLTLEVYDQIKKLTPSREKGLSYVESFDLAKWHQFVQEYLGRSGAGLVEQERKERKYDQAAHRQRLEVIVQKWGQILEIIQTELPSVAQVRGYLQAVGAPVSPTEIGISYADARRAFKVSKDIRNKYNASWLLWDLGCLDEVADSLWQDRE
ncbi:MAG TPA: sn-glycerol-1-phosphate dehydrogenase [Limnochordia bacterium]|nr:sn-glycerol-1-phosphate dehydrogenase [Limnochordia bacterium]